MTWNQVYSMKHFQLKFLMVQYQYMKTSACLFHSILTVRAILMVMLKKTNVAYVIQIPPMIVFKIVREIGVVMQHLMIVTSVKVMVHHVQTVQENLMVVQ